MLTSGISYIEFRSAHKVGAVSVLAGTSIQLFFCTFTKFTDTLSKHLRLLFLACRRQSHPVKVKTDDDKGSEGRMYDVDGVAASGWLCTRPELAYHILYACFFGFMALTTLRFKYLWTPHMCILASIGMTDQQCLQWLLSWVRIKSENAVRQSQCCCRTCRLGLALLTACH